MSQGNLKYTPQIAAKILELMSSGLSITAAAAELNITRRIIYKWAEEDRDGFAEIFELAKGKRQLHWERELLTTQSAARVTAGLKTLGAMRVSEWSSEDRVVIEHTTDNKLKLENLSTEELEQLSLILAKRNKDGLTLEYHQEDDSE